MGRLHLIGSRGSWLASNMYRDDDLKGDQLQITQDQA
jgi:hypothetical protein